MVVTQKQIEEHEVRIFITSNTMVEDLDGLGARVNYLLLLQATRKEDKSNVQEEKQS